MSEDYCPALYELVHVQMYPSLCPSTAKSRRLPNLLTSQFGLVGKDGRGRHERAAAVGRCVRPRHGAGGGSARGVQLLLDEAWRTAMRSRHYLTAQCLDTPTDSAFDGTLQPWHGPKLPQRNQLDTVLHCSRPAGRRDDPGETKASKYLMYSNCLGGSDLSASREISEQSAASRGTVSSQRIALRRPSHPSHQDNHSSEVKVGGVGELQQLHGRKHSRDDHAAA
jgi:hypothetical protein